MIYSREVEEMCPVAQGVHHGAAPIPEEAKWVQAKEVKDVYKRQSLASVFVCRFLTDILPLCL